LAHPVDLTALMMQSHNKINNGELWDVVDVQYGARASDDAIRLAASVVSMATSLSIRSRIPLFNTTMNSSRVARCRCLDEFVHRVT